MSQVALTLGPLEGGGRPVWRSGLRWLCDDGHLARPGQIVAFCNLGFGGSNPPFAGESYDLQVAFAPRVAGRIRRVEAVSNGGLLDRVPNVRWAPETAWAQLEPAPGERGPAEETALLFFAGRRHSDAAEERSGFASGWHNRKRAWWGEGDGATLLAPATCHQTQLIAGDDHAFGGLFEQTPGPAHVVMPQGEPFAPCAAVFNEQRRRTPDEHRAIREDIARSVLGGVAPAATGWLFVGALLDGLEPAPPDERYDLMTRAGLRRSAPASAICLSLEAEVQHLRRHRRLGYALNVYGYRLAGVGMAVHDWLQRDFELVVQSVDDVAAQYRRLVAAEPDRAFVFVNRISSLPDEAVQSYDLFDEATLASLGSLRAQDLNLMLHDVARAPNVEILDADAIAADLGIARHMPEGRHATRALQQELQAELRSRLRALGVAGFG